MITIPPEGHTNLASQQRDLGNKGKRQRLDRLPTAALAGSHGQGAWTREMPVLDSWRLESESKLLQAVPSEPGAGLFLLLLAAGSGGSWLAGATPTPFSVFI